MPLRRIRNARFRCEPTQHNRRSQRRLAPVVRREVQPCRGCQVLGLRLQNRAVLEPVQPAVPQVRAVQQPPHLQLRTVRGYPLQCAAVPTAKWPVGHHVHSHFD